MSQSAPRPVAGDVGTDNRIECEAGHYWVRLWSREAIRREGDAMANCLRRGGYDSCAGSDHAMNGPGNLWSLRDSDGASIALADVGVNVAPAIRTFLGPKNAMPSALAYRQVERLLAFYMRVHGCKLQGFSIWSEPCVIAADGSTYRWDRGPKALRLPDHQARLEARRRAHDEAKKRREAAERMRENQPPIPKGEVGRPHYYGDGLDADQPPFEAGMAQRFATAFAERLREGLGVPGSPAIRGPDHRGRDPARRFDRRHAIQRNRVPSTCAAGA